MSIKLTFQGKSFLTLLTLKVSDTSVSEFVCVKNTFSNNIFPTKKFTRKGVNNTQILTHTGVRKFECQEWGKDLPRKVGLIDTCNPHWCEKA